MRSLILFLVAGPGTTALTVPHARVVFMRHGQSAWNVANLFTGWHDVELTELGVAEATSGGIELAKAGIEFDLAFTSRLKRAQNTCAIALKECDQSVEVIKDWRLNERHYGALQGMDKKETVAQYGKAQVQLWRRSYDVPPPPVEEGSVHDPRSNPLYSDIEPSLLPTCECLKDTVDRCLPLWHEEIAPALREGKTVLVAAHGNSIRGLLKYLDNISEDEITGVEIPTGVPLVYDLDASLNPIPGNGAIAPLNGCFLGDADVIAAAAAAVAAQTAIASAEPDIDLNEKLQEVLPLGVELENKDLSAEL